MLIKKTLRDIRKSKVQFLAIFLMMFFGCFLFSGITGEWSGLLSHFQTYIKTQDLADQWVYRSSFSRQDVKRLKKDKKVKQAEGRLLMPMNLKGREKTSVDCYFADSNKISKLFVKCGESFDSRKKGVWLDEMFAKKNGFGTGDTITFVQGNMKVKGKILGLVYSPEYIYGAGKDSMVPDHKNSGFAWISPKLFPLPEMSAYNQIAVKTSIPESQENIAQKTFGSSGTATVYSKDHPSVSMIMDEIKQHQSIGTVFSLAFLFIALMITSTTMHRMLKNQRPQIGILKALGFTKEKLTVHYLSHTALICVLGAGFGYVLGYRVLPDLIYRMLKEMYILPRWGGSLPAVFVVLPAGCTLICLLISFFVCRTYLKGTAAESLSEAAPLKRRAKARVRIPDFFSFSSRWNLRDIGRNRLRSFMTLCGILGCTALLFCAFALYDTFVNLSDWTFHKQQTYECKITDLPDSSGQKELLKKTEGEYLQEGSAVLMSNGKEKQVSLTVQETTKYLRLAENLHQFINIKEGIAVSKKTADRFKIRTGDTVTWKVSGQKKKISSKVQAVIRTPAAQGITVMRSAFRSAGQDFRPTAIIGKVPQKGFGSYEGKCTISLQNDLTKNMTAMMDGMVMMIGILVFGAVLLGSVMLYNLGVLSYMERYREFATLKVLGFPDSQIRTVMIQQNVWVCAAGIVLGLPAGYGMLCYLLSTVQESMDIPVFIRWTSWLFSAAGTLVLSWLISRIVSGKIPGINMVEALKAKE